MVRRRDGIALTAPPRTVFDAAAVVSPEDLESMIEQGIDRQMFIVATLVATSRRLARPGRAGSTEFRCACWPRGRHGGDRFAPTTSFASNACFAAAGFRRSFANTDWTSATGSLSIPTSGSPTIGSTSKSTT